jgi:DNA polymerase (family 10)
MAMPMNGGEALELFTMALDNAQVAAALDEIADLLEIDGGNPFRVRAYRNAARTIGLLGPSVEAMKPEELDGLRGIGADLAQKIREIARTGTCEMLAQLRQRMPPAITELLKIQGLGPHRVMAGSPSTSRRTRPMWWAGRWRKAAPFSRN